MNNRKRPKQDEISEVLPELTKRDKRVAIFIQYRLGISAKECSEKLIQALGDQAPSYSTVKEWYSRFRSGHTSFDDNPREGRPHVSNIPENVEEVRRHVEKDKRVTVRELSKLTGISHGTLVTILHQELHMKKLCARWIPHKLKDGEMETRVSFCHSMLKQFDEGRSELISNIVTGDETWIYFYDAEAKQQGNRQWVADFDDVPTKISEDKNVGKVMIAIFFQYAGILPPVMLEEGAEVSSKWYTTVCFPKVVENLTKQRLYSKDTNIFFHYNITAVCREDITKEFLNSANLTVLPYAPHSPDLAPCDFFLFPKIKRQLQGKQFGTREELLEAVNNELQKITKSDLIECFKEWFLRMKKCIEKNGDYFEET